MIQLVSDIFQKTIWKCHFQTHSFHDFQITCCFQTTSCCQTVTVHIVLCSCNCDCEHIMTICVNTYFDNIVCQISQFHQFNQFVNYVILITEIWISCHNCSSDHEHIIQHVQHVYQIIASLWQDVWFM